MLLAAVLCSGLGIFINEISANFRKEQELFEGIAVAMPVIPIYLMRLGVSRNAVFSWAVMICTARKYHGWAFLVFTVLLPRESRSFFAGAQDAGGLAAAG